LVKQFFYLLINIYKFDTIYVWFADYHAYLPILFSRIFNKKSIIILGGYDTMSLPQIGYGVFLKKNLRRKMITYAVENSNYLLGVDETMFEGVNRYIDNTDVSVGVQTFAKSIKGKCLVVPTGYDSNRWKKSSSINKENLILTIGSVKELKALKRKGFDFFSEVAASISEYEFVIIGPSEEYKALLEKTSPPNLTIYSFMEQEELKNYLDRAKVFCQFSLAEGLPNTLCEAMLCECIPVGSSVNGIPKAIDNSELLISKPDISMAKEAILYALQLKDSDGVNFRNRIIDMFPKAKREKAIESII
jgi:glycosyltransferase involved in cell wall biosynthesis